MQYETTQQQIPRQHDTNDMEWHGSTGDQAMPRRIQGYTCHMCEQAPHTQHKWCTPPDQCCASSSQDVHSYPLLISSLRAAINAVASRHKTFAAKHTPNGISPGASADATWLRPEHAILIQGACNAQARQMQPCISIKGWFHGTRDVRHDRNNGALSILHTAT